MSKKRVEPNFKLHSFILAMYKFSRVDVIYTEDFDKYVEYMARTNNTKPEHVQAKINFTPSQTSSGNALRVDGLSRVVVLLRRKDGAPCFQTVCHESEHVVENMMKMYGDWLYDKDTDNESIRYLNEQVREEIINQFYGLDIDDAMRDYLFHREIVKAALQQGSPEAIGNALLKLYNVDKEGRSAFLAERLVA